MIKPTVGRVVLYNPCHLDNLETLADEKGRRKDEPLVAFIIAVHSDTRVNLFVISAYGQTRFLSRVELWQGEGERPNIRTHGYAEWMPYQKAVAEGKISPVLHADPTQSQEQAL
jgi:hypothetical protein